MSKFLFLCDFYYPKPYPNAIVLDKVTTELIKRGHEIHVVAYLQHESMAVPRYNGVHIHYVQMRTFHKLKKWGEQNISSLKGMIGFKFAMALNKLTKLWNIRNFPMASKTTVNRFFDKSNELHRKHRFDAVIALFNPEDTIFALIRLKEKYPDIRAGAYVLDSLVFLAGKSKLPAFLREKMSWKFEGMVYEKLDAVYNMESHRIHHEHSKYDPFRHKLFFLDTPLYIPRTVRLSRELFNPAQLNIVYLGTLFESFRSPEYLFKLFRELSSEKEQDAVLHFYTRGDCERMLLEYERQLPGRIKRNGFVPNTEIDNIYANSHFLVNIGVSNSTNISSKIFDIMSTGKPILHFYYHDDDVNNKYLEEYSSALLIKMDYDLFESNLKRLSAFIERFSAETEANAYVDEKGFFDKNKPSYTASVFENLLK